MIFVVSGEGPSDIGVCTNQSGECRGADFRPGPMAMLIDQIVARATEGNYSPIGMVSMEYISKADLCEIEVTKSTILSLGKKTKQDTAFFTRNAQQLAVFARRFQTDDTPVAAILFRDTDGTRSTARGLYENKRDSIYRGFESVDFEFGVAMVPKPKSEAWILCALKASPYMQCENLEESLSGNDHSPNPAKAQLEERLVELGKDVSGLSDLVTDGSIDPDKIKMPSFKQFRDRLIDVTLALFGGRSAA